MKTSNKLKGFVLMAVVALLSVAVVFAAKHEKAGTKKATTYYYHYLSSSTTLASYQNASNWIQVSDPDDPDCPGGSTPCVVQSTQSTVSAFVGSITQIPDVTKNMIREKD